MIKINYYIRANIVNFNTLYFVFLPIASWVYEYHFFHKSLSNPFNWVLLCFIDFYLFYHVNKTAQASNVVEIVAKNSLELQQTTFYKS